MARTAIEWTEDSWNPIVGCTIVSPGCTNCYAMKLADRLDSMGPKPDGGGNPYLLHYAGTTTRGGLDNKPPVWTGKVALAPEQALLAPLRRKKPTTYFVNSMGDLFHEAVPDEWIDQVFAVMALAPQHTFQVLTKRAARMREYVSEVHSTWTKRAEHEPGAERIHASALAISGEEWLAETPGSWPLPNVWLGVSTEDQRRADERIPDLLATPAAVRFVSGEPLLGPIDFEAIDDGERDGVHLRFDALSGLAFDGEGAVEGVFGSPDPKLDWIIVGGESGLGARPMHPDWARQIRDQCAAAGTAFFFKQWGEWCPISHMSEDQTEACYFPAPRSRPEATRRERKPISVLHSDGRRFDGRDRFSFGAFQAGSGAMTVFQIGKAASGRLLDGVEHNAMPEVAPISPKTSRSRSAR